MKTVAVLFLGIFLAMSCSKDDNYKVEKVQTNPPESSAVAGLWAGNLDFEGMGVKIHLSFFMFIADSDSTYLLYVEDKIHLPVIDTVFWHAGKWVPDANGDTVLFHGDTCLKDDSLNVLTPYSCEPEIAVGVDVRDDGCWYVKVQDMEKVILSLDVSPTQYNMVKSMSLKMEKIEP
jgi:hypothetical protein